MSNNPMFPTKFTLEREGGSEVTIELHADGSWTGDGEAFLKAASEAEFDGFPMDSLIVWLLVRAISGKAAGQ